MKKPTPEYLQPKIQFFKEFRYLHENVSEEVCVACDEAIAYLERFIEDNTPEDQEETEEEYQERKQEEINSQQELENTQR